MRTPTLNFKPKLHPSSWIDISPLKNKTEYIELERVEISTWSDISKNPIFENLEEEVEVVLSVDGPTRYCEYDTYQLVKQKLVSGPDPDPDYEIKLQKYEEAKAIFEEQKAQYDFDLAHYNANKNKTAEEIEIETLRRLAAKYPEEFAK